MEAATTPHVHVLHPPSIPNTSTHPALITAGLGQAYEYGLSWDSLPLPLQVTLCPILPATLLQQGAG